ncbi:AMP-binding enzyme domain-containing protein [Ditylenchus destructor]|nr:AMP-binding enzyme domain-containing protein [Ditylenchus destructor]
MPLKSELPPVEIWKGSFAEKLLTAFWEHATQTPKKKALINAQTESDSVTFGQLYLYSHAVAAFLKSQGFGKGDIACVSLPNCWEFVPIFTGIALQGGAMSGISSLFTEYELRRQFEDCSCKVVFCVESNLDRVQKALNNMPFTKIVCVMDPQSKTNPSHVPAIPISEVFETEPNFRTEFIGINAAKDLLLLPYSSGTTGTPKGVMLSHQNFGTMINMVQAHSQHYMYAHLEDQTAETESFELLVLPFYHVFGFGMIVNKLLNGQTTVFLEQFDQNDFCKAIEKYKITTLQLVPPLVLFLAKSPVAEKYDLSSLKLIQTGAAPTGKDLCDELLRRFPNIAYIGQGFGMSELSLASHSTTLNDSSFGACGKLLPNMECKIVNIETRKELPSGERGEIMIRGPNVMMGYWNRPKETAETIDKDGWLITGDIGYVDDKGFLFVVDRLKELIKVKGFQVPPAELEDLLISHPGIRDCAVVGIPDEVSGEVPKAFVVKADDSLTEEQIKDFVKKRVAHYKQLKGGVEFVSEIPKSPAGKILRRMLRDKMAEKENVRPKSKI